jgi:hypothetical protein
LADRESHESAAKTGGSPATGNKVDLLPVTPQESPAVWLSPFSLIESDDRPVPAGRASNRGCLEMSFADYLMLLDWTGRQMRRDKRGVIPADVAPILDRLQVSEAGWMKLVTRFSRLFRRSAGTPLSLNRDATRRGQRPEGITNSRAVFA